MLSSPALAATALFFPSSVSGYLVIPHIGIIYPLFEKPPCFQPFNRNGHGSGRTVEISRKLLWVASPLS